MRFWHDFLDSWDSEGGKIVLLVALTLIGLFGVSVGLAKSEDIMIGAFGALLLALKTTGSNKDRRETPPPIAEVVTTEVVRKDPLE